MMLKIQPQPTQLNNAELLRTLNANVIDRTVRVCHTRDRLTDGDRQKRLRSTAPHS